MDLRKNIVDLPWNFLEFDMTESVRKNGICHKIEFKKLMFSRIESMIKSKERKTANNEFHKNTSLEVAVKSKNNFVYLMVCTKRKSITQLLYYLLL